MSDSLATDAPPPPPARGSSRAAAIEAVVVFGATVGVSLANGLRVGDDVAATLAFTNRHLLGVLAYEAIATALLLPWLVRRGWRPLEVAGAPAPSDVARGAGVWLLAVACYAVTWGLFASLQPDAAKVLAADDPFTGAAPAALAIVLVSVLNPVFEEFLWLGYGVTRLAPWLGLRGASLLSLVLRMSVHAYQGPWAILGVLPLGLAFTWYYGRTRRLWPVVVAHVLFDAIGLAQRLGAAQ